MNPFITLFFIVLFSLNLSAQPCEWAISGGSNVAGVNAEGGKTVLSASGGYYVSGRYDSLVTIQGTTLKNLYPGGSGVYIAKVNANGGLVWMKHIESLEMSVEGIAQQNDELYLVGQFQNNITIAGVNFSGMGLTGIILKFDSNGNLVWGRTGLSSSNAYVSAIKFVDNNAFLITGRFRQNLTIDGTTISGASSNFTYGYYGRMTTGGQLSWIKKSGEGGNLCEPMAIEVEQGGNFYIGGIYRQGLTIGSISAPVPGSNLANLPWIARFDALGNPLWILAGNAPLGVFGTSSLTDIKRLNNGQLAVTGGLTTQVSFLGVLNQTGHSAFAFNITASGNLTKSHLLQSSQVGNKYDFAAQDNAGNVWYGGRSKGYMTTINNGVVIGSAFNTFNTDLILAYYQNGTNYQGIMRLGGTGNDYINGGVMDQMGRLVITGGFSGVMNIVGTNISSPNGNTTALFLARICNFSTNTSTELYGFTNDNWKVWPIPAKDQIQISLDGNLKNTSLKNAGWRIVDNLGRELEQGTWNGQNVLTVTNKNWPLGTIYFQWMHPDLTLTKAIMVVE